MAEVADDTFEWAALKLTARLVTTSWEGLVPGDVNKGDAEQASLEWAVEIVSKAREKCGHRRGSIHAPSDRRSSRIAAGQQDEVCWVVHGAIQSKFMCKS